MAYNATVLKVMIASPGDVSQERRVARDVIHEWNTINAEDKQIVLMPVGWETHSTPEMGERPQAIINRQVLADSDLLVAIFWTRLGTPTGTADSGTVEEIEEALDAGKPVMLYFSSAPVHLDSVDAEQYRMLSEFKVQCRERGLIDEYGDITEFRERFSRQLAQTVLRRFTDEASAGRTTAAPSPSVPHISPSAGELLSEAVKDPNGIVMRLDTMDGTHVQTNNRGFVQPDDPRSAAKWRSAVEELQSLGLIEDRGGKGEVFFVTDRGYVVIDHLDL